MASKKYKETEVKVSKLTQGVLFVALGELNGHKVRFRIESDSYDFQCKANVSVWRPASLDWSSVAGIVFSDMQTESKLYYMPQDSGLQPRHFAADYAELQRKAAQILC